MPPSLLVEMIRDREWTSAGVPTTCCIIPTSAMIYRIEAKFVVHGRSTGTSNVVCPVLLPSTRILPKQTGERDRAVNYALYDLSEQVNHRCLLRS